MGNCLNEIACNDGNYSSPSANTDNTLDNKPLSVMSVIPAVNYVEHIDKNNGSYPSLLVIDPNIIENELLSIVDYADKICKLHLDKSRREFLERNFNNILSLESGKLINTNRFRELLLGVKAIGKTTMLRTFYNYVKRYHPSITAISIKYSQSNQITLVKTIMNKLHERNDETLNSLLDNVATIQSVFDRVTALEDLLVKFDIFILLLVDEFHFVYSRPADVGKVIVDELCELADSNQGRIHIIVSGSSSKLRMLAFAKLPKCEDKSAYPSYDGIDLNSTKLQPKWIYPMNKPDDFIKLCQKHGCNDRIEYRYIFSGGRPGLVVSNEFGKIPYNLSMKNYRTDILSIEWIILKTIAKSSQTLIDEAISFQDPNQPLEHLACLLPFVSEKLLLKELTSVNPKQYEEFLYRLADDGMVIFEEESDENMFSCRSVSLASVYLFFAINACIESEDFFSLGVIWQR